MFFPEPIKKITLLKNSDGFLYFNPEEEIESSLKEEEIETSEIRSNLKSQHKLFLLCGIATAILNIALLGYWAANIDQVYSYETSGDHTTSDALSIIIMAFMLSQFLWILNTVLGYAFLRYELNFGIITFFVVLNVVLFTRIALNLFVIVAQNELESVLPSFSIAWYIICAIIQIIGDVLLALIVVKIRYSIRNLKHIVDKKLYSVSISKVTVL